MASAPLGARGHRFSKPTSMIMSCVAATQSTRCVAATQLFFLYRNSYTRAARTYGALARAYYCQRCSAANMPLRGWLGCFFAFGSLFSAGAALRGWLGCFFAFGSLFSAGAPNARPYCCVGLLACQPNSLSA